MILVSVKMLMRRHRNLPCNISAVFYVDSGGFLWYCRIYWQCMAEYRKELQDYIDAVVTQNGSDIHIIVGNKPMFRVNRELTPFIQKEVLTGEDCSALLRLLIGSRADTVSDELQKKKHLIFSYQHTTSGERQVNFRVIAYLERDNVAIAMRLVQEIERTIDELNLPSTLKTIMQETQGLFLLVGPAGNGKSTTLAAMINHCNTTLRRHILTIEDPIEFVFQNKKSVITQREVPSDVPTFRSGLDSALRADADILMIGEMREISSIQAVITAAEVGHLVLSTVHANSAFGTVHRIIDSFPADRQRQIANQLADSLLGVCSVRLLPRISGGLVPACEVMINTDATANLIREGRVASIKSAIQTGREEGMISLEQSLADLVKQNEVALEQAMLYVSDKRALMKYL